MRVGIVLAGKFPDLKEVKSRLAKGAESDSTLVIRKRDHKLKALLGEVGAENVELWEPPYEWLETADAKANAFFVDVDHLLVFHMPGSTTDYFVKKATEWPYAASFNHKTTIIRSKAGERRHLSRAG